MSVPSRTALLLDEHDRARRALDRLAFGPTPGQVEAVAAQGTEAWIREQLRRPAPQPAVPARAELPGRAPRADEAARRERRRDLREVGAALLSSRLSRAVAGEHPLFESLLDFWGNHFAIYAKKGPVVALLPDWESRVLQRHALGRFGDLLLASARHPAMLFYLDNWRSAAETAAPQVAKPRAARRSRAELRPQAPEARAARRSRAKLRPAGLNENYARELLELHTLGVDGGYEQRDVREVARVLTGWTIRRDGGTARFHFEPSWHDADPKRVLGRPFPVGAAGVREGEDLLALLAQHPSTARHLAGKLAVRFLADAPPPGAVERGAAAFLASGGDIRATLEALLLGGSELFAADAWKVKTPFELAVSALRALGAPQLRDPRGRVLALRRLGQLPYLAPTPAGHPDVAERWIDPGAALERTRFAFALAEGHVPGVAGAGARLADLTSLLAPAPGPATRAALSTPGLGEREALAVVLASPEFQLR